VPSKNIFKSIKTHIAIYAASLHYRFGKGFIHSVTIISKDIDLETNFTSINYVSMKPYKFEDLPDIIGELFTRIDSIEKLLREYIVNTTSVNDELLTISEAAILLKLSVATIYSKVCRNEIPANKQGKRLYFCREELLNWIKSGRIKTIAEIQQKTELEFNSRRTFK
jgi:excisionase family DNA binding protein